jgi:hypothetical protein
MDLTARRAISCVDGILRLSCAFGEIAGGWRVRKRRRPVVSAERPLLAQEFGSVEEGNSLSSFLIAVGSLICIPCVYNIFMNMFHFRITLLSLNVSVFMNILKVRRFSFRNII